MFSLSQRLISKILLPLILFSPMTSYLMREKFAHKAEETADVETKDVSFVLDDNEDPLDLHTIMQNKFLPKVLEDDVSRMNGKNERSRPQPVELSWETEAEEGVEFAEYTVSLSTKKDMSSSKEYLTDRETIKIFNCYAGETYYWTVSGEYDGITYTSEVASFTTMLNLPRSLFVDGVTNVRDMGGWETVDGGRIRQGLVYRTGCLHSNDGPVITQNGIDTMLNEMNIRTEIDLRFEIDVTEYGPLGEDVDFYVLPMDGTDDILTAEAEGIHKFFDILSDENSYPLIFHCYIGTDRTGACAFLLGGLLGMSDEALLTDYLFSNFANIGGSRTSRAPKLYLDFLEKNYEGSTTSERIISYLLSIGVTEEQISTIIDIMVEKSS